MNYVDILKQLEEKREDLHFIKQNLEAILEELTKSEIPKIALEAKGMLKISQVSQDPYNKFAFKIYHPTALIKIHKIFDATIDLLIENTNIYKEL
ncbi:hypothetical protein [Epilithonimonas arachidiradicis]|uniref:Uncharacterized protein n=1 Tax=Epilithonimonas arachidiradicis TaxID=1617282 RepID=A0A420DE16_9FLAO|nr:hypothetical protein [Epilithonimonas arachidiradicis]RKE90026.1 hypothetical protein BXY58_0611 [Epilithonimonas arachidiradicis]GGG47187.1 hypothetical protein GCM10007332_05860 [Epilithonimonas arachidiradicis]